MRELINQIISNEELSSEEKSILIEKIFNASHGLDKFVKPGIYLHFDKDEQTDEIEVQLWYRNVDETGMTMHGPTNYSNDEIIEIMKRECLNPKQKTR